jgi:hypothetical protein
MPTASIELAREMEKKNSDEKARSLPPAARRGGHDVGGAREHGLWRQLQEQRLLQVLLCRGPRDRDGLR